MSVRQVTAARAVARQLAAHVAAEPARIATATAKTRRRKFSPGYTLTKSPARYHAAHNVEIVRYSEVYLCHSCKVTGIYGV